MRSGDLSITSAMKFFLPGIESVEETRLVYEFLRMSAQGVTLRITERKVYNILYKRMDKLYRVKVGSADPIRGEIVIAIMEAEVYFLIFTLNRGVVQGQPYLLRLSEVLYVGEFEE
jgi:hypothetical protein